MSKITHGETRIIIKSLRFDKKPVAILCEKSGVFLVRLPGDIVDFGIKI